jgi:hypothetical protein
VPPPSCGALRFDEAQYILICMILHSYRYKFSQLLLIGMNNNYLKIQKMKNPANLQLSLVIMIIALTGCNNSVVFDITYQSVEKE